MPTLEKFYERYQSDGLVVLAANATAQDYSLQVVPFVQQHGLTFPILLDETGELSRRYEVRSLPSSFFIARDGTVAEVVIGGPMSEALVQTYVEEILRSSVK